MEKKIQAVDGIDIKGIADGEDKTTFTKGYRNHFEAARVGALICEMISGGMTTAERSIQCICAWAAREREMSSAETTPSRTRTSTTLGSAINFRARLSDLLARNQPDLFEHFQHIIVVSLQGELNPSVPFKRTNLALWCVDDPIYRVRLSRFRITDTRG